MHLNPLKKDDNTDALVKALEDANAADNATAAPAPAATPSAETTPAPATDPVSTTPASDNATATDAAPKTDSSSGISFGSDDLPGNLSSDANAHLPSTPAPSGDLDGVKNSALEQLRPLIEKLNLEPADKFDKYLMMLRASDDPTLIKPAFEAAQGITGEKEKAQALLDIINEINYITANQQSKNQ